MLETIYTLFIVQMYCFRSSALRMNILEVQLGIPKRK